MIRPTKNTRFTKWHGDPKKNLTKCLRLLQECPWNGTWVKPCHSGNVHRDAHFEIKMYKTPEPRDATLGDHAPAAGKNENTEEEGKGE
jgi:hypothetical protein